MRVLLINQFFWPDVAPTGQFLCDVTRHLVQQGHDVTVICSSGLYAEAESAAGDPPPVKILRVPGFPYKRGALARLSSYSIFFAGALGHALRIRRPDLVVTMTTPPLLGVAGTILKTLRKTRHYVWEMDLFPDGFVAAGALSEGGMIARCLGWIENTCRLRSDGVIALGPCMRERLLARGIPADKIHVAENWADGSMFTPGLYRSTGPLNVLYSGNLGMAHDVDTIAGAIRHFRLDKRIVFTFAGGGVGRTELEGICSNESLPQVRFLPYANRERMGEHLGQADIGLVTERPEWVGAIVPSKMYGLMAAGRPVLFIGPKNATPALLIDRFKCGWQIDPGDLTALTQLLEWLSVHREEAASSGRRAREAFEEHYDLPHGVARVGAALGLSTTMRSVAREPHKPNTRAIPVR